MWTKRLLASVVDTAGNNPGKWMLGANELAGQKLWDGDVVAGVDVNFCDLPERDCWVEIPGDVNFAIYKGAAQQREKNDD